jgi:predicted component of type VI protein secretion system
MAFAGLLLPFGIRRRLKSAFAVLCLLGVVLYSVGCGSSSNSNNAMTATYTINITATVGTGNGAAVRSVPLTVNVVN